MNSLSTNILCDFCTFSGIGFFVFFIFTMIFYGNGGSDRHKWLKAMMIIGAVKEALEPNEDRK